MPTPPPLAGVARLAWLALLVGLAGQVILGHLIVFGLDGPLFAWHQDRVGLALWGSTDYGPEVAAYRRWIQAVLGGTMIAWAWTMLAIVAVPLRRREPWAVWVIVVSTLHWFVLDTTISAMHGVSINVAFNCVALASIGIPLALLAPWLRRPRTRENASR